MNVEEAKKNPVIWAAYLKQRKLDEIAKWNGGKSFDDQLVVNLKNSDKTDNSDKSKKEVKDGNVSIEARSINNEDVGEVSKKNKLRNNKVINSFGEFDSKLEFNHYLMLLNIKSLLWTNLVIERQREFELLPAFEVEDINWKMKKHLAIKYIADFVIYNEWEPDNFIAIDSKWFKTEKFRIKEKMFAYRYKMNLFLITKDTSINDIRSVIEKRFKQI